MKIKVCLEPLSRRAWVVIWRNKLEVLKIKLFAVFRLKKFRVIRLVSSLKIFCNSFVQPEKLRVKRSLFFLAFRYALTELNLQPRVNHFEMWWVLPSSLCSFFGTSLYHMHVSHEEARKTWTRLFESLQSRFASRLLIYVCKSNFSIQGKAKLATKRKSKQVRKTFGNMINVCIKQQLKTPGSNELSRTWH